MADTTTQRTEVVVPEYIEQPTEALANTLQELMRQQRTVPQRQVVGFTPTQQAAFQQAFGGIGSFQPFLDAASQLSGPQAFQQFMSPYQQQVIDTTLTEFDRQTAKGVPQLAANAIQAGAFGGGREGVAAAEYASQAAQDRAALQARLLGEGFTQAQNLAQTAFNQQLSLIHI